MRTVRPRSVRLAWTAGLEGLRPVFFPCSNYKSFLWQMTQKTKKTVTVSGRKGISHTKSILPNLPVTKPKKLALQMFYRITLNFRKWEKMDSCSLTPRDSAAREPGADTQGFLSSSGYCSNVPGSLSCRKQCPSREVYLADYASSWGRNSSLCLKAPPAGPRTKLTGGRFTEE